MSYNIIKYNVEMPIFYGIACKFYPRINWYDGL